MAGIPVVRCFSAHEVRRRRTPPVAMRQTRRSMTRLIFPIRRKKERGAEGREDREVWGAISLFWARGGCVVLCCVGFVIRNSALCSSISGRGHRHPAD